MDNICEETNLNKEHMRSELLHILSEHKRLGIADQMYYDKFNLYSLVTHSAAMSGIAINEIETQLLIEEGLPVKGKSDEDQQTILDLFQAYQNYIEWCKNEGEITPCLLQQFSATIMAHTGKVIESANGSFDVAKGELRKLNVTAGVGGSSYLDYQLLQQGLDLFCAKWNNKRKAIKEMSDVFEQCMQCFEVYYDLSQIHPWGDGNNRMARLLMNGLQIETGLLPSKVKRENKASCISAWTMARNEGCIDTFLNFLMQEHIENLSEEIRIFMNNNGLCNVNPFEVHNEPQNENSNEPQERTSKKDSEPQDLFNEPQRLNNEPQREQKSEPQRKFQISVLEDNILELIRLNKNITREEIAQHTGASLSTIKRRLKQMGNRVVYVGSGYSGHWELVE